MDDASTQQPANPWGPKKLQAMRHVQHVALDLFDEFGYRNVTVERVAAAAEVSPSSIYRYFTTKEMLVLWDEYDPQVLDLLRSSGGSEVETATDLVHFVGPEVARMLEAIVKAGEESRVRRRMRYATAEPDVKAGLTRQTQQLESDIVSILADRIGRDRQDLEVRLIAASWAWGFHAAMDSWTAKDFAEPLEQILDRTIAFLLQRGEASIDQRSTTSQTAR